MKIGTLALVAVGGYLLLQQPRSPLTAAFQRRTSATSPAAMPGAQPGTLSWASLIPTLGTGLISVLGKALDFGGAGLTQPWQEAVTTPGMSAEQMSAVTAAGIDPSMIDSLDASGNMILTDGSIITPDGTFLSMDLPAVDVGTVDMAATSFDLSTMTV